MGLITQPQYDEIISWFKEGGKLMQSGCTPRFSQQLMVDYITSTFDSCIPLICEAPTGVGKTYSYLFPLAAIIADSKKDKKPIKAVVSTSSKGLQRQLLSKDFPAVANLFPSLGMRVWMGASNYLCGARLRKAAHKTKLDPEVREQIDKLNSIYGQLRQLPNGWREELPMDILDETWDLICGDTPCCAPDEWEEDGFFCKKVSAYRNARESDILCVNHSLLCNLALYRGTIHPGLTKDFERLILVVDESHDLEDNIRRCLNHSYGFATLRQAIKKVSQPAKEQQFHNQLSEIKESLTDLIGEEPEVVTSKDSPLCVPLGKLTSLMTQVGGELDFEARRYLNTSAANSDDAKELATKATQLRETASKLRNYLLEPTQDQMLEVAKSGSQKNTDPQIQLCPFDLETTFKHLWELSKVQILTSATIFNASELETKKQYGLPEAITTVIPPNFDYGEAIKAYAVDTGSRKALTNIELTPWIKTAIEMSAGNALVLFTSYASMHEVYTQLQPWAQTQNYNLLMQSRNTQPQQLIEHMAAMPNTIIFGTNTFWTGIDIRGKNLCNVIVTKLPFRMPDNYVKQYGEYLSQKGLNPFFQWSVPDMVNKTRQGIGRLIRHEDDRGLLFVLDPRFLSMKYGNTLKQLIYPRNGVTTLKWESVHSPSDLEPSQAILDWLGVTEPEASLAPTYHYDDEDDNVPF